jgi:hypothetical protein
MENLIHFHNVYLRILMTESVENETSSLKDFIDTRFRESDASPTMDSLANKQSQWAIKKKVKDNKAALDYLSKFSWMTQEYKNNILNQMNSYKFSSKEVPITAENWRYRRPSFGSCSLMQSDGRVIVTHNYRAPYLTNIENFNKSNLKSFP